MKRLYILLIIIAAGICQSNAQIVGNASMRMLPATNGALATSGNFNTSRVGDSLFNHIQVLPNIANGQIILRVDDANQNVMQAGEYLIYNNAGQPILRSTFNTGTNTINLGNAPAGMYYLRLIQKNGQTAVKAFMIMR